MKSSAAILLALTCTTVALSQTFIEKELPNGYVESLEPSSDSYNEDSTIHGTDSERDYLPWKNIHKEKSRTYFNLKKKQRKDYRDFTGNLIVKYWTRGAMNDLYRICMLVYEFQSFIPKFVHDAAAHVAPPIEALKEIDESGIVQPEYGALHRRVMATPPGFRLIPLTNVEHFGSLPGNTKKAFAGLGALTLSYPQDDMTVIKRRLERHYRWADDYDEDLWKEPLKDYRKEQASIDAFVAMLGNKIVDYTSKTAEAGEQITKETLFMKKIAFFRSCFGNSDVEAHITQAIELLASVETMQASFSRGARGCGLKSRNQMSGLTMRIGSTVRVFLDSPSVMNLLAVGAIGVIGTPLVIDINGNGTPDLLDDDWRPDSNVKASATVNFDLDGDGVREKIEWVKGHEDALLAIDHNGNGIVDNGFELFGATGGYEDGYDNLSHYDLDNNGFVEKDELKPLKLWVDDGDGICTLQEMFSPKEFGIQAISTSNTNKIGHCVTADGQLLKIWDWYTEYSF